MAFDGLVTRVYVCTFDHLVAPSSTFTIYMHKASVISQLKHFSDCTEYVKIALGLGLEPNARFTQQNFVLC